MPDIDDREEDRCVVKVLWHVTMSLDGFISGPGDAMDWAYDTGPNETAAAVIRTTGALIVRRRAYEVEDRDRGGFYGGAWTGPLFVLTSGVAAASASTRLSIK
jgi:hypothetical protein